MFEKFENLRRRAFCKIVRRFAGLRERAHIDAGRREQVFECDNLLMRVGGRVYDEMKRRKVAVGLKTAKRACP